MKLIKYTLIILQLFCFGVYPALAAGGEVPLRLVLLGSQLDELRPCG